MDLSAKQKLNSLKCPLCQGQIDLIDWQSRQTLKGYNFGCAFNYDHYAISFVHWDIPSRVEREIAHVHTEHYRYEIIKIYWDANLQLNNAPRTIINVFEIDAEGRIKDNVKLKQLTFQGDVVPFDSQNVEKLLNRIKTILVFQ